MQELFSLVVKGPSGKAHFMLVNLRALMTTL